MTPILYYEISVLIGALAYAGIQLAEIRRALSATATTGMPVTELLAKIEANQRQHTELLAKIEANQRQHAVAILSGIGAVLKAEDPTARRNLVKLRAGLGEIFVARFKDWSLSPEIEQMLDEKEAYAKSALEALERYGLIFEAGALDYAYHLLDQAARQRPESGLSLEARAKASSQEMLDERLAFIKRLHAARSAKPA